MKRIAKFIVILVLCKIYHLPLLAQVRDIQFESLNTEHGLSSNCVNCIVQDNQGFMWFGTSNGLNRWDGYTFKVFTHDPDDSNSISNDYINSLYTDEPGYLWIGTRNGLNRYDPQTEKFSRYLRDEEDSLSISNNCINAIFKDKKDNLWFGSENKLICLNLEK